MYVASVTSPLIVSLGVSGSVRAGTAFRRDLLSDHGGEIGRCRGVANAAGSEGCDLNPSCSIAVRLRAWWP